MDFTPRLVARSGHLGRLIAGGVISLAAGATFAYAAQPSAPDLLPRDLIGVVGSGDSLSLRVTVDQTVKTLAPGDQYRDGWTLKAITTSTATLTKAGESRIVGLNPTGALNEKLEEEPSKVTVIGDLAAAIAAGDVGRIMQLKGSPMDVIAAQRAILARNPDAIVRPAGSTVVNGVTYAYPDIPLSSWMASNDESLAAGHIPIFINDNGRTVMAIPDDQGRLVGFTTVPGMNLPGVEPLGIPYKVPVPSAPPPPPPPPPPRPAPP